MPDHQLTNTDIWVLLPKNQCTFLHTENPQVLTQKHMFRGTLWVCHLSSYLVSKYKDAISAEKHLPSEVNKGIVVILWKRRLSVEQGFTAQH